VNIPEPVIRAMNRNNLSLGLGLNKVAGKVFRIGHLGNVNELQLLGCLAALFFAHSLFLIYFQNNTFLLLSSEETRDSSDVL
jgi:hypothetical protein